MPSKAVASASTSAKRSRDNGSNTFRDSNVLCVLEAHCDDAQVAQLLVQHRLIAEQGRGERHENTNNPDKGNRLGNDIFRLLKRCVGCFSQPIPSARAAARNSIAVP
jgi:hypothetical protein